MKRRMLLSSLALVLASGACAEYSAEAEALRTWLRPRYREAYVSVRDLGPEGLDLVVHVLPRDAARAPAEAEAHGLVEALRRQVLAGGRDFAAGSQVLVFGVDQFSIEGTGAELERVVRSLAGEVIQLAGDMGLGVLRLGATGYSGGQVALEVHARGVDLGEARRASLEAALQAAVRQQVFGRHGSLVFLQEQSRIQVLDRPLDAPEASPLPAPTFAELADPFGPTRLVPALPEDVGPGPAGTPPPRLEPVIGTVYFDSDRAALRPEGERLLREMLAGRPGTDRVAVIVGHTDSRNTREYNQALGKRRAEAVARFLAEHGLDPAAIEPQSHGERDPVAPNDGPENMQRNRRAEVEVLD